MLDFDFYFGVADLDFDLGDFDVIDQDEGLSFDDRPSDVRYWKPRVDKREILRTGNYRYARDFVENVDLSPGARTYAWVDGSFIFGDVIEAFADAEILFPKRVFISTLSMSQENIDSLRNCVDYYGLEKIDIVLSDYFYSHEKFGLVPYLYQTLDAEDRLDVAFAHIHTKIIGIETQRGNKLILHGSANMRTCGAIEQVMCECSPELYDFNAAIVEELIAKYGTINKQCMRRHDTWQAVLSPCGAETSAEPTSKTARKRRSAARAE